MRKQLDLLKAMFPDNEIIYELDQDGNVIDLILFCEQLKELPKEIGLLTSLTSLDLEGNNLQELPKEIILLTNLRCLILSNNEFKEIPKEIEQLLQLRELYLDKNHFREFPEKIGRLEHYGNGHYKRSTNEYTIPRTI